MTNPMTTDTLTPCVHCDGNGGTDRPCTMCHGRGERRALVLCDGCGEYEATRDGLCMRCDDDVREFLDRGYDDPASMLGALDGARYYTGDDEGELLVRGVRC